MPFWQNWEVPTLWCVNEDVCEWLSPPALLLWGCHLLLSGCTAVLPCRRAPGQLLCSAICFGSYSEVQTLDSYKINGNLIEPWQTVPGLIVQTCLRGTSEEAPLGAGWVEWSLFKKKKKSGSAAAAAAESRGNILTSRVSRTYRSFRENGSRCAGRLSSWALLYVETFWVITEMMAETARSAPLTAQRQHLNEVTSMKVGPFVAWAARSLSLSLSLWRTICSVCITLSRGIDRAKSIAKSRQRV